MVAFNKVLHSAVLVGVVLVLLVGLISGEERREMSFKKPLTKRGITEWRFKRLDPNVDVLDMLDIDLRVKAKYASEDTKPIYYKLSLVPYSEENYGDQY